MSVKKNKHRYYNLVIRQDFSGDGRDFKKGDKIRAIVCPLVSNGIELYSICDKENDSTYVIPCQNIKFAD